MATTFIPSPAPGPYTHGFAITTSDTVLLSNVTRAIYIGGAGNVKVLFANDTSAVTLTGLLVGWWYEFAVQQVFATGTTATNIVGLY